MRLDYRVRLWGLAIVFFNRFVLSDSYYLVSATRGASPCFSLISHLMLNHLTTTFTLTRHIYLYKYLHTYLHTVSCSMLDGEQNLALPSERARPSMLDGAAHTRQSFGKGHYLRHPCCSLIPSPQ